ncbi:MAG: amidohydrolase family protein [Candidatus Azotimanducaceae bacterium]|nr:hydrolase [Gammaproteobacteria bacterium]
MNGSTLRVAKQKILIKNVELFSAPGQQTDISVSDGVVTGIGDTVTKEAENIIDAGGGLLLPGLNDHHVHLTSYAASLNSVCCGPPSIVSEEQLAYVLNKQSGNYWLRGTEFHESVLEDLDRAWLDKNAPERPIRIQHRSGRLWIFNSLGLEIIQSAARMLKPHERNQLNSNNGRLYDVDEILSRITRTEGPPIDIASKKLAALGITGINDMTPTNDPNVWNWLSNLQESGDLLQKVRLSGLPSLTKIQSRSSRITLGETKVHLHDSCLPDFGELVEIINISHKSNRGIAVHCVTETELVFTLAAFKTAGTIPGDRIEHASMIPPTLIEQLFELNLGVVTQPNFIFERGDNYIEDIPEEEHPFLYRCKTLLDAGIPVAFGTDLPFGNPSPWVAVKSATNRRTKSGSHLGNQECISLTLALQKFLGELSNPFEPRSIEQYHAADFCLLDAPWAFLNSNLSDGNVRMTIRDGEIIYDREEEKPH